MSLSHGAANPGQGGGMNPNLPAAQLPQPLNSVDLIHEWLVELAPTDRWAKAKDILGQAILKGPEQEDWQQFYMQLSLVWASCPELKLVMEQRAPTLDDCKDYCRHNNANANELTKAWEIIQKKFYIANRIGLATLFKGCASAAPAIILCHTHAKSEKKGSAYKLFVQLLNHFHTTSETAVAAMVDKFSDMMCPSDKNSLEFMTMLDEQRLLLQNHGIIKTDREMIQRFQRGMSLRKEYRSFEYSGTPYVAGMAKLFQRN